eukprot:CAMPEP_0119096758 /NCGR_PEP_ID=MMETSP1178-20130426/173826_1 /TAXON_ID=33656 /ORGANISM="unid sp, Strain CCMP2000" /LENGTH=162 /DNA_ID=CAMNT_0007080659 /DNA_START=14 /DNA_END=502 /DNA_ORIENTATION=+
MRPALATAGLLHFAGCVAGLTFRPSLSGTCFLSPRPRVPAPRANEFDLWWAARGRMQRADAPGALPLNTDSVALVLTEFVNSEFARRLFKPGYDLNAQMDDGQIGAMFESVKLTEATLVVKLKRAYGERNEVLLERLCRYLRVRIPQLAEIKDCSGDDCYIY